MSNAKPAVVMFLTDARCIGWSNDFTQSHYQNTMLLSDGSRAVMYNTHIRDRRGFVSIGVWTEDRPVVTRPNPVPASVQS